MQSNKGLVKKYRVEGGPEQKGGGSPCFQPFRWGGSCYFEPWLGGGL